ncbi:hypothetical protein GCM10009347_35320 [Shewanella algicola]|uniref:Uncharacterized protein n=1 Tax=Shewanella algicola TaxID=640633 RepID=A0A9X1ZAN8_9GAMM|nr:hypothetical protein [Shewanella algicola]MCL1107249.1 hypothetical protein [Shewanella algicola]GGP66729.1 hypothetical protein GCM10009347_35320 [Shewanella algicola]
MANAPVANELTLEVKLDAVAVFPDKIAAMAMANAAVTGLFLTNIKSLNNDYQ